MQCRQSNLSSLLESHRLHFQKIALTAQGRMGDNEQKARAMVQDAEKKLASKPGFLSGIFG